MADVTNKVLRAGVKLQSVQEFRTSFDLPITSQAVRYLMREDLIDYIPIGSTGKSVIAIVLTEKTKNYRPKSDYRK